jgi:flagellin-like hook-associated protein FlgL
LAKLNQIWSAIGLANMSAISVAVGANPGTTVVSATGIVASAGVNALSGIGGASVLKEQNSLTIRTGIYADAKGNWTDDKKLASALGLAEIIYTVENNDYTAVKAQASFMNENVLTSGSLSMTSATKRAISAAGLSISQFTCANVSLSASAATSALALLKLQNDALAYWASVYGVKDNVVFTAGDNSASVPNLTVTDVTTNNVSNLEGVGAQDEILSGQTITVNTGVYIDDNGNWTQDKSLASAFGLSELVYEIERPTGANSTKYSADITYGSSAYDSPRVIFSAATYGATGVGQLASAITASIREAITYLQSQAPSPITPGLLAKSGQSQAPAPTAAQLAAAAAGNYANLPSVYTGTRNPSGSVGNLDVFFTLSGVTTIPSLGLSVGTNMTTLADALSNNLSTAIQTAQNNAKYPSPGYSAGRLLSAPPSNHGGPADETQVPDLATVDHYKQASGPQTITTTGIVDKTKHATLVASAGTAYLNASGFSNFGAWALASAINHNAASQFWAMVQPYDSQGKSADMVYIFTKKGGDFNNLLACDVADGDLASQAALQAIQFENVAANEINQSGTNFTLGGEHWGTLKPVQTKAGMGKEVWNLTINGRDVGKERDLWIAALSNGVNEINTPGLNAGIINGLDRHSFVEIQNADNGPWTGAEVRTQSSAQEALEAINDAMARKDKVRADIGALQNRLENTITNLEIQMEALQASESRISDVDVATEMTEFVRNQVLAQAAVSMLSQANSLPQMALSLLNG